MESAICLPTLDEELKSFKAIVRYIMRHEAEGRNRLRRLAKLGIIGHQPAIVAYCKVSMEERDTIIERLLKQKVGSNPKRMKTYYEYKKAVDEAEAAATPQQDDHSGTATTNSSSPSDVPNSQGLKIRIKHAKVALGAAVRWQRRRKQEAKEGGNKVGEKEKMKTKIK